MKKISLTSKLNYIRLFYRGALLLAFLVYYILCRVYDLPFLDYTKPLTFIALGIITLSFIGEMIERFIPSKTSSMGSQKQFKKNYLPSGENEPEVQSWKATFLVFISWVALNAVIATLYYLHIFDEGILVLIALFYSISDMICILFFCPFQTWMMHNRCCGTCRIYNWDFAMMFTPLIFIMVTWSEEGIFVNPYAIALVATSLILLARWEITYHLHKERFSEKTNMSLRCENCKEKLCLHKTQLQHLIKKSRELLQKKLMKDNKEKD